MREQKAQRPSNPISWFTGKEPEAFLAQGHSSTAQGLLNSALPEFTVFFLDTKLKTEAASGGEGRTCGQVVYTGALTA